MDAALTLQYRNDSICDHKGQPEFKVHVVKSLLSKGLDGGPKAMFVTLAASSRSSPQPHCE